MSHAEVFGFECPTCGETLGAKLPEKNMVIACSACGLEFAVKRPVKVREQHQRRHPQRHPSSSLPSASASPSATSDAPKKAKGALTETVLEQAQQGRVHSIDSRHATLDPAVARRVVPELLSAGCSLRTLDMSFVQLDGTWAATFGKAAVSSTALHTLRLIRCGLQGPLPELRLPALQVLDMNDNQLTGGLEPLQSCAALQELFLNANQLAGGLEPLSGCTGLTKLLLYANHFLTGGLEPLQGCTALQTLDVGNNKLTGGLEPLRACTALQTLDAGDNKLTGGFEALRSCKALEVLRLNGNLLTGGLEPLRGCTALRVLFLQDNQLDATDEDKAHLEQQCRIFLA